MNSSSELEKLYYFNESEIFKILKISDEFILKSDKAEKIEEVLRICSCDDNQKQLTDCIDAHNDKTIVMMKETFKYAFSLANKLMIESIKNNFSNS